MPENVFVNSVYVRILLDGVLFQAVEDISVSFSEGGVRFSLSIPYSHVARPEELYGCVCQVFWADQKVIARRGGNPGDAGASEWPILCQGEMSSFSMGGSVESRSMSFDFVGHSRHYDQTLLFLYDPSRGENVFDATQRAAFLGNHKITTDISQDAVLSLPARYKTQLLNMVSEINSQEKRNIAFSKMVQDVMEDASESHAMFRIFNAKLNLDQRFTAFSDPDIGGILPAEKLASMISNQLDTLSSNVSVQDLIDVTCKALKYRWVHIGMPRLDTGEETSDEVREGVTKPSSDVQKLLAARSKLSVSVGSLARALDRKRRIVAVQGTGGGMSLNLEGIGPITLPQDYFERDRLRVLERQNPRTLAELSYVSQSEFIDQVMAIFGSGSVTLQASVSTVLLSGVWVGDSPLKPGQKPTTNAEPSSSNKSDSDTKQIKRDQRERLRRQDLLNEFVAVPEMTFSQPPRCNVITPDLIEGWGGNWDYFSAPTRLYATTMFEGVPEIYIAPSTEVFFNIGNDNRASVLSSAIEASFPADDTVITDAELGIQVDD